MKNIATLLLLVFILVFLTACGSTTAQDDEISLRPIRAVATTGMVADVVKNVGGDRVLVTGLMGPGVDPHLYKPSERSVIALADADVIFYNGLHLEAGMAKVFERMDGAVETVATTDGIDRAQLSSPPEFQGNYDPHVWFDVQLWMDTVNTVRDALIEMDPQSAQTYRDNAAAYLSELDTLDQYIHSQVEKIPEEKRVLITAHDAFNYFGRAYGFEVRGLQGISTASEAGTADVQALADFIVERDIPAIFVESSVPTRTIEAVQAAVRARGAEVQIGGQLFSDAMGSVGTPQGSYPGMVRHNIDTLVRALSGG